MSLYLGIFDGDNEIDGWVMGHYSDFACFRDTISAKIPDAFDRYPTLMRHSDSNGEWAGRTILALKLELEGIAQHFKSLPPEGPENAFEHTAEFRRGAKSLFDCFHNVDGENLFQAIVSLCDDAIANGLTIVMQ